MPTCQIITQLTLYQDSGQGGAQALEDVKPSTSKPLLAFTDISKSAALGALLPLGTEPCEIASRLELYSQARKTRAEAVQEVIRQSTNDYKAEEGSIKPFQGKIWHLILSYNGMANRWAGKALEFVEHSFNHDAYHHGNGILRRHICRRSTLYFSQSPWSKSKNVHYSSVPSSIPPYANKFRSHRQSPTKPSWNCLQWYSRINIPYHICYVPHTEGLC